jgi:hypothetical protein
MESVWFEATYFDTLAEILLSIFLCFRDSHRYLLERFFGGHTGYIRRRNCERLCFIIIQIEKNIGHVFVAQSILSAVY